MSISETQTVPTERTESTGPAATSAARVGRLLAIGFTRGGLLIAWAALTLFFCLLEPDRFATARNIEGLLSTQSVLLVLAIGLIPPLICGDLDLSPPATMGLVLTVIGVLNVTHHWSIWTSMAVGVALAVAVGLTNGLIVVVMGVDSIVATLGMSTLLAGVTLGVSSLPIPGISPGLVDSMTHPVFGLQVAFYLALGLTVLAWFVLAHTPTGRRLFFVGASRATARLSGLRVDRLRFASFLVSSVMAAIAGIMLDGLFASSNPGTAPQLLLPALAAVFLGATAITPGRFNVWGTFAAVYFLVFGISGLEIKGISGWVSQVFYGGSLVVAVVISKLGGLRRRATAR